MTFRVKLELLLISPSVRTVRRNEYRHVAHNFNSALQCVVVKFIPLLGENELLEFNEQNFVGKFFLQSGKDFFIALFNLDVPLNPIRAAVFLLNRRKQCVIFQPIFLSRAESFEVFIKLGVFLEFGFEILERFGKCRLLELGDAVEFNPFRLAELERNFYIRFVKQAVFNQRVD